MHYSTRLISICTISLFILIVRQVSANTNQIQWSGFGTVMASYADSNAGYDFGRIDRELSFSEGSLLGLNGSYNLEENWTAIFQLIARGSKQEYSTYLDWAQINWQISEDLQLRIGKQMWPVWMVSDHIEVGVLYPWIRPPLEVYSIQPLSTFTGLTLAKSFTNGEHSLLLEAYGGNALAESDPATPFGYPAYFNLDGNIESLRGLSITYENSWLMLRSSYATGNGDLTLKNLSLLCQPSCGTASANTPADFNLGKAEFTSAAARLKFKSFLIWVEAAETKSESAKLNKAQGSYITFGYRFKSFLPYITTAYAKNPTGPSSYLAGSQKSFSIGTNYFLSNSIVLKAEFNEVDAKAVNGFFENNLGQPGPQGRFARDPDSKVQVYNLALNFAF